jgi:hypothetical protein
MAKRLLARRIVLCALAGQLFINAPARAGAPGVGGIVYDPSNWVQNYNSVVNSLTQIGQLSEVIAQGGLTIQNLFSLIGLGQQTIKGVNGLISDTTYLLSGRLFLDYANQIAGIFNTVKTQVDGTSNFAQNSHNLDNTGDFTDLSTATGQQLAATLMDGQEESVPEESNHDRLVTYVDNQMNVALPNMYNLGQEVLEVTYKISCVSDQPSSLPPEILQVCQAEGLDLFNIPTLMQAYSDNYATLSAIQQTGGQNNNLYASTENNGQNASFSLQIETTQQNIQATLQQSQLMLQNLQMILAAKQAKLEVARASLERSAREEEIRNLSVQLTKPNILSSEIQQFYGP